MTEHPHQQLGFEHQMHGASERGRDVEVVTPAQEQLERARNTLNRIRALGDDALPDAVDDANSADVDPEVTEEIDLAGIVDATEWTQPKIVEALRRADETNPAILTSAFEDAVEGGVSPDALEHVVEGIENSERSPESAANYRGNWTEAQIVRMRSPGFIRKFEAFTRRGADGLGEELSARAVVTRAEYLKRIDDYEQRHRRTTDKVEYQPSGVVGLKPVKTGWASYGDERVILFSDATVKRTGEALTDSQKDIVVAHELYHTLVNPRGDNVAEVRSAFDLEEASRINIELGSAGRHEERTSRKYRESADELAARMALVKNYFGMMGDEVFTQAHLDYARLHYVEDTGLDNSMSLFFKIAKDKEFVKLMNELPL